MRIHTNQQISQTNMETAQKRQLFYAISEAIISSTKHREAEKRRNTTQELRHKTSVEDSGVLHRTNNTFKHINARDNSVTIEHSQQKQKDG